MKQIFLGALLASALFSCNEKKAETLNVTTAEDSVSYAFGVSIGQNFKMSDITDVNVALVEKGIQDVLDSTDLVIPETEVQAIIQEYFMSKQVEKQAKMQEEMKKRQEDSQGNIAKGEEFLSENAKKEGVQVTESGLQYEIIEEGNGETPLASDVVKVHYHGTLLDGTVFDSSVDRGEPIEFPVNGVIKGWQEALQLMPVGSKFKVYIPQELAYGAQGAGTIPPYSALIFDIELIDITTGQQAQQQSQMPQ